MTEPRAGGGRAAHDRRVSGRRRGVGRPARRRADARAARTHQRPFRFAGVGGRAMAVRRARQPVSDRRAFDHRLQRDPAAAARDPAPHPRHRRRRRRAPPDVLVIIDSPDFTHRVAKRVRAADAGDPDRRLCLALGLGVAAGPRARDAQLRRSRAGAAAVRAGGPSQAGRAALQLCRPSADRGSRRRCARTRRRRAAGAPTPPVLLVLPGSRSGEIQPPDRHVSAEAVGAAAAQVGPIELVRADHRRICRAGDGRRPRLAGQRRGSWSASGRSGRRSASRVRRWPSPAR